MNKTPIAAGLAMIMGISVVFAFDRVKPIEDAPQNALYTAAQMQVPIVDSNIGSNADGRIIVSQAAIEANILMEEAPLILESTDVQRAESRAISDGVNDVQPVAGLEAQQDNGHRSLKMALADMQLALERLEREAQLTQRAVASLEQNYR